jgi:hypothetical protein
VVGAVRELQPATDVDGVDPVTPVASELIVSGRCFGLTRNPRRMSPAGYRSSSAKESTLTSAGELRQLAQHAHQRIRLHCDGVPRSVGERRLDTVCAR